MACFHWHWRNRPDVFNDVTKEYLEESSFVSQLQLGFIKYSLLGMEVEVLAQANLVLAASCMLCSELVEAAEHLLC